MRRSVQSLYLLPLIIVIGLISLAGCSPAAGPAPAQPQQVAPALPQQPQQPVPAPVVTMAPAPQIAPTSPPAATAVPPTQVPEVEIRPTGTFTGAVSVVRTMTGWPPECVWCADTVHLGTHEALFHAGRGSDGGLELVPWIVDSWETSGDLTYTDFKLHDGIEYHKDWGPMTAHDVVWYFNLIHPLNNPESRHDTGVQQHGILDNAEVVDNETFRFNWAAFAGHTLWMTYTDIQEGMGPFSKSLYDDKGIGYMEENIIGSGPFEVVEWTDAEVVDLQAVPDHWRKTPYINRVRMLHVPEAATRRAMLENRQVQAAEIALKDWPALFEDGFTLAPETTNTVFAISMAGNYWQSHHPTTGEPLERTRDISKPWVGDPFENGDTFDPDTPSMQSSKLVREAMSITIEREAINDTILSGIGLPHHLGGIWADDPLFIENQDRWSYEYNPDRARELMAEAGYKDGFEIEWYGGPGNIEIFETVAAGWLGDLGIETTFDRQIYTSWRPTIVNRTNTDIFGGCCYGLPSWPLEWPQNAANFPGGYNTAQEFDESWESFDRKSNTTDPEELKAAAVDWYDFLREWHVWPGIVQHPGGAVYDPDAMEWEQMRPFHWMRWSGMRSFEWIRLK